ncbi:MAG TPA: c-type cytochrome [Steroidobacteraceae bacterium]|nr:c-type cytochrome [Steroidobacteraceae bacterium]
MNGRSESARLGVALLATLAALSAQAQSPPGDATRGQALYQACTGCHSVEDNDIGPKHRGVVGRTAGSVPDYTYSPALKASGMVWSPANLDRWLANPQALVPGAKMYFSVADAQARADLIAYLQQLR